MFSSEFYNTFKIIFWLGRALSTFSLQEYGVEKHKYGWIRTITMMVVFVVSEGTRFKLASLNFDQDIVLFKTSTIIVFVSNTIYMTVLMIGVIAFRNRHIRLILDLNELQEKFEGLYGNVNHSDLKIFTKINATAQGTATVLVFFGTCFLCYQNKPNSFEMMIGILTAFFSIILSAIFSLQVASYIFFVKTGFRLINREISQMAQSTLDMPNFHGTRRKPTNTIIVLNEFCDIHHHLIGLITSTNEAFGMDLLAMSFLTFSELVVGVYYVAYWKEMIWIPLFITPCSAFWLTANMMVICHSCHDTVTEAKKTGILLYDIDTDEPELENAIDIFTLQIANEKVEFNAAGFFCINYRLLFMIFGAVATYIIILIQLSNNT